MRLSRTFLFLLALLPVLSGCDFFELFFGLLSESPITVAQGTTNTFVFEIGAQAACYQPGNVEHACAPEVQLSLRGARQGATYAPLPVGLSYGFSPEMLIFTGSSVRTADLTIGAGEDTPPGTYPLTVIAKMLGDGRFLELELSLVVSGDEAPFTLGVNPTSLTLNDFGYTTTHVTVTRQADFAEEVNFELQAEASVLASLDYFFGMADDDPDDQVLVIQLVTLAPGTYALAVVATSASHSVSVPITLTVPEQGGEDCQNFTLEFSPNPLGFTSSTASTEVLIDRLGGFSGEVTLSLDMTRYADGVPPWLQAGAYEFSPNPTGGNSTFTFTNLPSQWPTGSFADTLWRGEGGGSAYTATLRIIKE